MTSLDVRARRFPPGPPRSQAMRMLRVMNRDRLGMMTDAAAQYGDAVRIPVGPKWLYFFNHPDHAKHVLADNAGAYHKGIGLVHARRALGDGLLTSEGDLWRKQRKVIQPAFQNRRIVQQAGVIATEAAALVDRLRAGAAGGPVDVVREMTGLTLGVLGAALMDTNLRAFANVDASFAAVQEQAMFELATLGSVPMFLPLPHQLRFRKAKRELQGIVSQLVAERGADVEGRDDVLSRLILSVAQESDPRVAKQRLNDELVTLLLAGHETTASTLSWSLYLIDAHPEIRERLHEEAVAVLGDRLPVADDLHRLQYTHMVIEEVMRLYPPVWILPRAAQSADEIGGYHVPSGADVLICPFTMHRHPDFWPDPLRFDPSRFDPAAVNDRPRYAYLPFGAGPRFCVGNHLGMMEAVLVLATLMRDLELRLLPGREVVPEPMMSLRIRGGLPMTVHDAKS
ncbi:cytochrome P450 [Dactylosporangium sp. CS-033363]|uniref:cytochrome P450 n=1 Tax=Dactylosporangium sp. CS-033363 TaxID=3239935 RepID=UPI003D8C98B7